ncbi:MAG: RagB/SusD family nutrient uptake outer membrane protein [Bacteroidetes bacterium]|nr:RagB/SusD family nutrient uptake outer membrane protein [Bacteroidota bacterium]
MQRKTTIIVLATFVLLLMNVSCSKDFLDTKSPKVALNDFFTSEADANSALTACYDVMGWDADNYFPFWLGDILGHDSYKGGEGAGDQPWIEPLLKFQYDANIAELNTPYQQYYIAINRCNRVVGNVALMTDKQIDPAIRERIVGEAKFIRGYFYFELEKLFGEVPLVTTILEPGQYNIPKATNAEIWQQIEKDFSEAAQVLPNKSEEAASELGRATKGAAEAFLCKAYIFEKKWDAALGLANEIIQSGEYSLETNYSDNWKLDHENGQESVFEIQFTSSGTGDWGDDNEGNVFVIYTRSRNNYDGWGFDCPKQEYVDEFEPGDPRKDATIIYNGEVLWPGTADETVADNSVPTCVDGYMTRKYQLPPSEQADMSDDPNNWKVIRYSEVLLWAAEAAAHTGGDWNSYLQQVRDRVGMPATPFTDPLKAVYHERQVELGMEGQRLWDVIRQGRGAEVLGKYGYVEGVNNYYPIPQTQIDLSNGILKN